MITQSVVDVGVKLAHIVAQLVHLLSSWVEEEALLALVIVVAVDMLIF